MGRNNSFYNIISNKYSAENYAKVVEFWEQEKRNIILNISLKEDYLLLDAVCNSYYQIGLYKKALNIINRLLKFLYSIQNNYETVKSIDYFLFLKSEIYRKTGKLFLEYKILLVRKKVFKENEYDEYIEVYEKTLFKRFLYPLLFYFPLLLFIMIMILHRYFGISIMHNILYQVILVLGVLWIIYSTIFYKKTENHILKIFRKILCLNYKPLPKTS